MPDSIPKEVGRGWELLKEGAENPKQILSKNKEALQLVIDFEKREDLKPYENLRCLLLKAYVTFSLGETEEALKIIEKGYQESVKVKKPLFILDFLYAKVIASYWSGRPIVQEDLETMENLLKSASHKPHADVEEREAGIIHVKAAVNLFEGNYDLAVEFMERTLEICERLNYRAYLYHLKNVIIANLGAIYDLKGEFDLALQYMKQHIERYKDSELWGDKLMYSESLKDTGLIYYQQGDLDNAIDYFKKDLELLKQINIPFVTAIPFYFLISTMLEKNTPELAKEYLDRFNQYNEILKNSEYNGWYKLSEAVILKASTRTRDRAEAEKILKKLLERHDIETTVGLQALSEEFVGFELCDIYLDELRTTNNLEILGEIHPLIKRLLKWSELTNSFIVQAKIKLLQGQLALLEMNMGDARRYLSQAQQIAETHGLHLLARKVSYEHDKLLEQLDEWETFKKKKTPISERMDLVSLEETVDLILKKRALKPPELIDEIPVLLLIITEGGIPAFSNPFTDEWTIDDGRISNFLRAFNVFSEDIFSKGLDRAIFGEYTLIMEPVDSFSVCYLFKGQSYSAKQKLSQFIKHVQNTTPLLDVLKDFHTTHQAILLSENPPLQSLITEIFIKKSPEISTPI